MKYVVLTVLMVMIGAHIVLANQLEDALNQQYKDRVYTLRQPMTAPTQQYDSLGNSPTASAIGPWTIYARVQIKKIRLEPSRVIVEGERIGMECDQQQRVLVPVRLKDEVALEISVNPPLDSVEQFHSILAHIFAFSKEDFLASVPELWRKYVAQHLDSYEDDGTRMVFKRQAIVGNAQDKPERPSPEVFHIGHGVTAPKPIYQPDPQYSDAARKMGYSGTNVFNVIIDPAGRVSNIELQKPLGLGLDEMSVQAIQTWKFQPAKRNDEPVAVEVAVETSFELSR